MFTLNLVELFLLVLVFGVAPGIALGIYLGRQQTKSQHEEEMRQATEQFDARLIEMQDQQRQALREAKEETAKVRTSLEMLDVESRERRGELKRQEQRLQLQEQRFQQKEETIDRKSESFDRRERQLLVRAQELDQQHAALEELRAQRTAELQRVAQMTLEEARAEVIQEAEQLARRDATRIAREIEGKARNEAETKAREIITLAIQRCASDQVSDVTVSVVPLPNDEMKGRIIGREGRNIRALEGATGVDLIIDDTPEAVVLSGFDPVRREVARIALTKLILDGRIHPARIEEVVAKARRRWTTWCAKRASAPAWRPTSPICRPSWCA